MTPYLGMSTNMRSRISRNSWTKLLLLVVMIGSLEGCDTYPRVKGEWTGRVVPIEVYDQKGVAHAASEFKVVKGPKLKSREHPPNYSPLLIDSEKRIINPSLFDPDALVVVRGVMSTYNPWNPEKKWIVGRDPTRIVPDLAIRVRGKPKILKD